MSAAFRADRKLLSWWASAIRGPAAASRSQLDMLRPFILSFDARLCHGGVEGANHIDRRLMRPSRFAPAAGGTGTACPTRP